MNLPTFAEVFFASQGFDCISGGRKKVFLVPSHDFVMKLPIDQHGSEHNFGEWNFWKQTKSLPFHIFLQPTLFSVHQHEIDGHDCWINFQKIGFRQCLMSEADFTYQMLRLTDFEAINDMHHFYKKENFFFDRDGGLRIVDYGSPMTQELIRRHGEKIYHSFEEQRVFSEDEKNEIDLALADALSHS
jgi:hypothetical protein